jgi:hypothetical protein
MNTGEVKYYNFGKVLSFNAVYNFIVGARGLGKSFGAKKKVINDAIKKGDQFIYLRRYKTELVTARATFFADVEYLFPNHDFRVNGWLAEFSPITDREEKKRKWKTMGFFIALSTAQNQKSVSFPNVKTIIFDEFIIEKGSLHYLPDESIALNNFYSTVDRYKDKTKVLFLANSVSIMNPYFIAYEIVPNSDTDIIAKLNGFIVAHFPDSKEFENSVYQTRFGKFIKDTDYADYAVGNTFEDNKDTMLALKDSKARYMFTLECRTGSFSVWFNMFDSEYYIQCKLPKVEDIYTLIPEKMDTHKTLMSFSDRPLSHLRTMFTKGKVSFDKPATRNTFTEIFKR